VPHVDSVVASLTTVWLFQASMVLMLTASLYARLDACARW
jgi:hypothetical protein